MLNSLPKEGKLLPSKENNLKPSPVTQEYHGRNEKDAIVVKNSNLLPSKKTIACLLISWYFFSFATLFLNKYILSYVHGDPTILGSSQLLLCSFIGCLQIQYTCGVCKPVKWERSFSNLYRHMLLVGSLRFSTLFLGLVALWYVPVSFAETVKSTAPVFTVILAWLLMGEKTSCIVVSALIPIMGGLALCSANELSFNLQGFAAAMATNLSECLQNVYSKKLLSNDKYSYSPHELQFYSSVASIMVQIPCLILMIDVKVLEATFSYQMFGLLAVNGISFHCQSMTEYTLLRCISPVTHSVTNTVKRALLIWLSVIIFGNKITLFSRLGTAIVIFGVFGYIRAREMSPSLSPCKEAKCNYKV